MGLVLILIVAAVAVLAIGYIRSHPKPADEALETYVEEVGEAVVEEVKQDAEEVVTAVKKRVRKKPATTDTATGGGGTPPETVSK